MTEVEQVEKDINNLTDRVKELHDICTKASNGGDPETLSVNLLELARVNSGLGRRGKYAMYIARNAEHAYKAAREQYKVDAINAGKSATYGDTQRYIRSTDDHRVYSEALLIGEQAGDLAYRTDTFLDLARSRLSLIGKDIRNG